MVKPHTSPGQDQELTLRDYVEIFLKRKNIFFVTCITVLILEVFFIYKKPLIYETSARILIGSPTIQVKSITGSIISQRYEAQNEIELMKSDTVISRAVSLIKSKTN
jgi:uncharacterized protein involved in exopolysaccharide biosynthesis